MADDLLDGVQHQLVVWLDRLQRARRRCGSDPERAEELLEEGTRSARSALAALRELADGIHPATLTHKGLEAAVDELAARQPLPVAVDVSCERFPPAFEASLYFFTADALSDVVKHAHATHASVSIGVERDHVSVVVADDGYGREGLSPADSALPGMADRVEAFAGSLSVTSEPHGGTTLRADVPWPAPEESSSKPGASETGESLRGSLSASGERALILAAANGDPAAGDRLVAAFAPQIAALAHQHSARSDAMQDGATALLEAARRYDPDLGTPFWPYAMWWIRRAMRPCR